MKYKVGQNVFYFTSKSDGVVLWHDKIRSLTGNGSYPYSFVTSPVNSAWWKAEKDLFESEEEALNWVKRPLGHGEGVYNAE